MICENCGENHSGKYGSGRFCSIKCAKGFSTKAKRQEINKKVSKKLKINIQRTCSSCDKPICRHNKSGVCISCIRKKEFSEYGICNLCDKKFKQQQGKNRSFCNSCNTKIRRYINKQRCVDLLGGKCINCGYDKDISALELHHKDPSRKEFVIGSSLNKSWNSIKEEVLKCDLLCSICHRIEHSILGEKIIDKINKKGYLLTLDSNLRK